MARYRLYIDESGDHTVTGVKPTDWDKRHLCLFACAIDFDYCHGKFCPELEAFKEKHFGKDPDDPAVLHLEEIQAKSGRFEALRKRGAFDAFEQDFSALVKRTNVTTFAVLIDKIATQAKRYGPISAHAYHIGLLSLLERYCGFLKFFKHTGDVLAESRGGAEDLQLKAAYESVYKGGTRFHSANFFQEVLTSKEIKVKKKHSNTGGLQFSDMFALPARRTLLAELRRAPAPKGYVARLGELIEGKYNYRYGTGEKKGYGKIFIL